MNDDNDVDDNDDGCAPIHTGEIVGKPACVWVNGCMYTSTSVVVVVLRSFVRSFVSP